MNTQHFFLLCLVTFKAASAPNVMQMELDSRTCVIGQIIIKYAEQRRQQPSRQSAEAHAAGRANGTNGKSITESWKPRLVPRCTLARICSRGRSGSEVERRLPLSLPPPMHHLRRERAVCVKRVTSSPVGQHVRLSIPADIARWRYCVKRATQTTSGCHVLLSRCQ